MKLKTDFENLNEAPEVGEFSTNGGTIRVYVYSKEGPIPHAHLVDAGVDTCVRLDTAEYFIHGKYHGKLNAQQKKDFIEFMRSKTLASDESNWEAVLNLWNIGNKFTISPDSETPDYRELR